VRAVIWRVEQYGSPFRALQPFDARHSAVFFGRDRKVQRAIDELLRASRRPSGRPFLLVVGPSGAGKSSLVRAGVIPRLTRLGVVAEIDVWRTAVMHPEGGATVFEALAGALFVSETSDTGGFGPALPELKDGPYKTPGALAALLEAAPEDAVAPILAALEGVAAAERERGGFGRPLRTQLLLLVDQLEEIFASGVAEAQRIGFAKLLMALTATGQVWVVATLRDDLYPRMISQPFLAIQDLGGQYILASPSDAELSEILEKSAIAAGLVYQRDETTGESLDERLLRDATGADTLPLLEFSLEELFERRHPIAPDLGSALLTWAAYRDIGGLDGAINQVAETAIAPLLSERGQDEIDGALRRLLRRLAKPVRDGPAVIVGQSALTRRTAPLDEAAVDELSGRLIETLMRARLLVSGGDLPGGSLRLAHERVLTSWHRAHKAAAAQQKFYRVSYDVEHQRGRWLGAERRRDLLLPGGTQLDDAEWMVRSYGSEVPEDARAYIAASGRRARLRQRLTTASAVIFFGVGVLAWTLYLVADKALHRAQTNYAAAKNTADALISFIPKAIRMEGIGTQTVDGVFDQVNLLLTKLENTVREDPGPVMRLAGRITAAFRLPGEASGGDIADLRRSRSRMLYEFAETYHQSLRDDKKALAMAEESFRRRKADGDGSPARIVELAESQQQIGDLRRRIIEEGRRPWDYTPARKAYGAALQLWHSLFDRATTHDRQWSEWGVGLSRTLTRMGDLERFAGPIATPRTHSRRYRLGIQRMPPDCAGRAHFARAGASSPTPSADLGSANQADHSAWTDRTA
jgi:hypothetical protein